MPGKYLRNLIAKVFGAQVFNLAFIQALTIVSHPRRGDDSISELVSLFYY